MANNYTVFSVAVTKDEVPARFESANDITHLYTEGRAFCVGYSVRSPALSNMMGSIVRAYGKQNLVYLSSVAAALAPERAGRAADELRSLLAAMEENPRELIDRIGQDVWTESEVIEALRSPVKANPRSVWDGDDLPYVIEFLKAHLAVLSAAGAANLHVLHGRSV